MKDNKAVHRQQPSGAAATLEVRDAAVLGKEASFYYVRVRQQDGQIAWGSPIWVRSR